MTVVGRLQRFAQIPLPNNVIVHWSRSSKAIPFIVRTASGSSSLLVLTCAKMSYNTEPPQDPVEKSKFLAATRAIEEYITQDDMKIGVGSGSTIVHGIHKLAQLYHEKGTKITCVPTSFQSRQLITQVGLPLSDLSQCPQLDVAFDGADECDRNLDCIKGGGGCHLLEKIVASCAKKFVIIADDRKQTDVLGKKWRKGVPVEVISDGYFPIMQKIEKELNGKATLRMGGSAKAGPIVTDKGNFILDVEFGEIKDPSSLHSSLIRIPGIVETGLFCDFAEKAYFGKEDGTVDVWQRS